MPVGRVNIPIKTNVYGSFRPQTLVFFRQYAIFVAKFLIFRFMKRLILLLLVFVSVVGNAQSVVRRLSPSTVSRNGVTDGSHLEFMGISIKGTLASFSAQMENKGFKYFDKEADSGEDVISFVGPVAGYQDCLINVGAISPEHSEVCSVGVEFPDDYQWTDISTRYYNLKRMLSSKYGEPAKCVERFQTSTQPKDDFTRMQYAYQGSCEFKSVYETKGGNIELRIVHIKGYNGKKGSCYVALVYIDRSVVKFADADQ